MQTPRRYAPMGGSFAPVRVAAFKWNGWQASAVYAHKLDQPGLVNVGTYPLEWGGAEELKYLNFKGIMELARGIEPPTG